MAKELYTTHDKVNRLLRLPSAFTTSSNPNIAQVENLIEMKMDEIDEELKTSFHLSQATEYHPIDDLYSWGTGVRVFLNRSNIVVPLDLSQGDSLKVFNGSTWEEYVGSKTEGRGSDFWLDERTGILHLQTGTGLAGTRYLGVDVTYRFNEGARSFVSGAITSGAGTIELSGGKGFPMQGVLNISGEQVRYSQKVNNTFTVSERGTYNTTKDAHADGDVVFYVPRDIEELCNKMVAVELLNSEDWSTGSTVTGDLPSGQTPITQKIAKWQKDIEDEFNKRRPIMTGFR